MKRSAKHRLKKTVREIRAANARRSADDIQKTVDDAVREVRTERWQRKGHQK
jgi:hypothetical protein